jgi:hypothetical protein
MPKKKNEEKKKEKSYIIEYHKDVSQRKKWSN